MLGILPAAVVLVGNVLVGKDASTREGRAVGHRVSVLKSPESDPALITESRLVAVRSTETGVPHPANSVRRSLG